MKKLLLPAIIFFIIISACKKESPVDVRRCKQCVRIVTDSASGDTLQIETGSPSPKAMYYCDGALDIVESTEPYYRHYSQYLPSKTQKFTYSCK